VCFISWNLHERPRGPVTAKLKLLQARAERGGAALQLARTQASVCLRYRRFCRKRFFGENELYQHMHAGHEQCFLCRRSNPEKYVYYRDYEDLESELLPEVAVAAYVVVVGDGRGAWWRWRCG
jgi:hypothetical protein